MLVSRNAAWFYFLSPPYKLLCGLSVCDISGCPREAVSFFKFTASLHLFPFQIPSFAPGCPWRPCTCQADLSLGTTKDASSTASSPNRRNVNHSHHKSKLPDPVHYNAFSSLPALHSFRTSLCPNLSPTLHKHTAIAHLYPTPQSHCQASRSHPKVSCHPQSTTYHPCVMQLTHLYPPQRSTHLDLV